MISKSVERLSKVHECVTDDRQTDHATEKCIGIGGIPCVAEAILPPKNYDD